MTADTAASPRSRLVAALLCAACGWFGAHQFYVDKVGTGLLMVVTIGGFGVWALVDLLLILAGSFADAEGRPLRVWLPADEVAAARAVELRGRMDRIDHQLTDLQGALIAMADRLEWTCSGRLV